MWNRSTLFITLTTVTLLSLVFMLYSSERWFFKYSRITSLALVTDSWFLTRAFAVDKKQPPVSFSCYGSRPGESEDLFCLNKQELAHDYKNPCWRDVNGTVHCLPYFHLIGSDKCGTTDLFFRISSHPDVEKCSCVIGKESEYWAWRRYGIYHKEKNESGKRNFSSYIAQFDVPSKKFEASTARGYHQKVVGDGSAMDFSDFRGWRMIPQNRGLSEPKVLTPHLMRHIYENMKFLLILRNPVDRLYSDYFFLSYGNSSESFHKDVIESVNMMRNCFRKMSARVCFFSDEMYDQLPGEDRIGNGSVTDPFPNELHPTSYTRIHIGCYSVFLKEWLAVFPRESFIIIRTEDYRDNIAGTLRDVYRFLNITDLKPEILADIAAQNHKHVTMAKKTAGPMLEDTRRILTEFYDKYNAELADILEDMRFLWPS